MNSKLYTTLLCCCFAITFVACKKVTHHNFTSKLSWLEGEWVMETESGILTEKWRKTENGFEAFGFMLSGKDTIFSELLKIKAIDKNIYFGATVFNQNNNKEVDFLMISDKADSLVFENKYHDYPTRISYINKSKDKLLAKASGTVNGKPKEDIFHFSKKP